MATTVDRTAYNLLIDDDGSGNTGTIISKSTFDDVLDAVDAIFANTSGISIAGPLTFPATQVPSADPNALDDYEEGTYVPVLQFGGANVGITYSVQAGTYTKVGNRVSVEGRIRSQKIDTARCKRRASWSLNSSFRCGWLRVG